jgi:hypothetical protein
MTEPSEILSKLIKNQKNDISLDKKLTFTDLIRISNNLPSDIFSDNCCIWLGYVTNLKSKKNNCYISFFYKNKKVSLHRLLFSNYIGNINNNEYIKYTCNNKGTCCTLNHMKKVFHDDTDETKNDSEIKEIEKKNNNIRVSF